MVRAAVVFISGGARSGKSAFAEKLITVQKKQSVYIASGVAFDNEMQERIDKHKEDRIHDNWRTIEQPVNLHEVLPQLQTGDAVLWDCMTTWLANEMYEGFETLACWQKAGCLEKKIDRMIETIEQIAETVSLLVIVSNEVLDEWSYYSEETECYRRAIGTAHQRLVQSANIAIEVEGGLAEVWKGDLKELAYE